MHRKVSAASFRISFLYCTYLSEYTYTYLNDPLHSDPSQPYIRLRSSVKEKKKLASAPLLSLPKTLQSTFFLLFGPTPAPGPPSSPTATRQAGTFRRDDDVTVPESTRLHQPRPRTPLLSRRQLGKPAPFVGRPSCRT